jgi:hypothetical protein
MKSGNRGSGVCHYFDPDLACARAVEFRKVNALPGAQLEFSPRHEHEMGLPEQTRFDVGSRIPLRMRIVILPRNDFG